jgi:hypothetical protein
VPGASVPTLRGVQSSRASSLPRPRHLWLTFDVGRTSASHIMDVSDFITQIREKGPEIAEADLVAFESQIGCRLPDDYRQFLMAANGGTVEDDRFCSCDFCIVCIGGLRDEEHLSLVANRDCYQLSEDRIPKDLLWIMEDAFGNAVCIGISGERRGRIYFWEHESQDTSLLANSFTDFLAGITPRMNPPKRSGCASMIVGTLVVIMTLALIILMR